MARVAALPWGATPRCPIFPRSRTGHARAGMAYRLMQERRRRDAFARMREPARSRKRLLGVSGIESVVEDRVEFRADLDRTDIAVDAFGIAQVSALVE